RHDGGIIDVHIDLAEAAGDLIDHSLYPLFVANVDMHREGFACCAQLGGCFFFEGLLEIRNKDFCFFLCQKFFPMLADPLPASRNDNNFVSKHNWISKSIYIVISAYRKAVIDSNSERHEGESSYTASRGQNEHQTSC